MFDEIVIKEEKLFNDIKGPNLKTKKKKKTTYPIGYRNIPVLLLIFKEHRNRFPSPFFSLSVVIVALGLCKLLVFMDMCRYICNT